MFSTYSPYSGVRTQFVFLRRWVGGGYKENVKSGLKVRLNGLNRAASRCEGRATRSSFWLGGGYPVSALLRAFVTSEVTAPVIVSFHRWLGRGVCRGDWFGFLTSLAVRSARDDLENCENSGVPENPGDPGNPGGPLGRIDQATTMLYQCDEMLVTSAVCELLPDAAWNWEVWLAK